MDAPMTEAQAEVLARRGVTPDDDLTWVEASLLIDRVAGTPVGAKARAWLRENGAVAEETERIIDEATRALQRRRRQALVRRRENVGDQPANRTRAHDVANAQARRARMAR
jgi:hypothetical protein